jgi:hypothetical protein
MCASFARYHRIPSGRNEVPRPARLPRHIIEVVTARHLPVLLAVALFAGCGSRGIQNEGAVRQGVIDYLSQRSDLSLNSMQVDVTSVSFRQDEADATVSFRPKGAAGGGMQMRYTLQRKGDRWVVQGKGRAGAGQSPHGQMPAGMAGSAAATAPASALPPGHPAIGNPPGAR